MKHNDYYRGLVNLYETKKLLANAKPLKILKEDAESEAKAALGETPDQQEEPVQNEPAAPAQEEEQPLDDASYLDPSIANMAPPVNEAEKEKLKKLFDLYKDLINYSEVFYESLDLIDTNLLDKDESTQLIEKKLQIDKIKKKLDDYLLGQLATKKYEESLYIYILLRTELVTLIRSLRNMLKLDVKDENLKDESNV